jgi:hypothetical protein
MLDFLSLLVAINLAYRTVAFAYLQLYNNVSIGESQETGCEEAHKKAPPGAPRWRSNKLVVATRCEMLQGERQQ